MHSLLSVFVLVGVANGCIEQILTARQCKEVAGLYDLKTGTLKSLKLRV